MYVTTGEQLPFTSPYFLLWSTIVIPERERVIGNASSSTHALRLAAGVPLDVVIDSPSTLSAAISTELIARRDQLRSLYVLYLSHQGQLGALRTAHLPKLETMCILSGGTHLAYPTTIVGLAPDLKHLRIAGAQLPPGESFTRLTRFSLAHQRPRQPADWLHNLLTMLGHNPSLREFHMLGCGPLVAGNERLDLGTFTNVRLPELKRLYWHGCNLDIMSLLLRHLELPEDGLSVDIRQWYPRTDLQRLVPAALQSRWRLMKWPITAIDVTFDDLGVVATSQTSVFSFQYPLSIRRSVILGDIQYLFPFDIIQTLHLWGDNHGSASWTVDAWKAVFGGLPSLANLVLMLQDGNTEEWLRSLAAGQLEGTSFPVPSLRILRIALPLMETARALLPAVLCDRNNVGYRLETLHIVGDTQSGGYESEDQMRDSLEDWLNEIEPYVDEVKFELMTRSGYLLGTPVRSYYDMYLARRSVA